MTNGDIQERMGVIEKMIVLFRLERTVYLVTTVVSLVMLLVSAGVLIYKNEADKAVLGFLFGSSGLITYSLNDVLRMWDQAIQMVMNTKNQGVS